MEHDAKNQKNRHEPPTDAESEGRGLSGDDATVEFEAAVDSTARVEPLPQPRDAAEPGQACLQLIEAIRLTAPEYLADILNADTLVGDETAGPSEAIADTPIAIGRFQIERTLGRGGHAVVFLAHDPALNRQIALKMPRPETLMTESLRRRFLREAEAAAALNHPNILPIYETGTAGPVCYIAAAYCGGNSLAHRMQAQGTPFRPRQAAEIIAILADAVQHAHDRGILHRDIKPSNVLLDVPHDATPISEGGSDGDDDASSAELDFGRALRLADFGLARLGESITADSMATGLLGTPNYMAPEQASGQADLVTTTTDVYGLGATFYHLLTGRPPLQGENQVKTLLAVREQDAAPPSEFAANVSRDLDAICLKCLEKDPARRYHAPAQLRDDLHRYLQGIPVQARHVGRLVRSARWCRRRPALSAVTALMLISMVAGGANVLWQWSRAERHLAASQRERQRAVTNLQTAQQAVDELLTEVAQGLADTPQLQALRRNLLLKAAKINEQLLQHDQADGELQLDSIRAWRRAADIFAELKDESQREQAIENGMRLASLSASDTAVAELAALYRQRGDLRRSQQVYEAALADYQHSAALWDGLASRQRNPEYLVEAAETSRLIGMTLAGMGKYEQADGFFEDAVTQLPDLPENQDENSRGAVYRVMALRSLGNHYRRTGRRTAALQQYELVVPELEQLIEDSPLSVRYEQQLSELRVNIGDSLRGLSRHDEAEPVYDAASASLRRLVDDFPLSPSIRLWLARCCMGQAAIAQRQDRMHACEALFQEATDILSGIVDRLDDPAVKQELVNAYGRLSKLRRLRDDLEGSEEAALSAVQLATELVSGTSPGYGDQVSFAIALFDAGCLQMMREDYDAAADMLSRSAEIRVALQAENSDDFTNKTQLVKTYAVLSSAEMTLGQHESAADRLRLIPQIAPDYAFGRCVAAIGWLQLAHHLETEQDTEAPPSAVEEYRQEAIHQLNLATELEDFDLPSVTRMEIFSGLMHMPEYRAQLADVYQKIDLSTLPPPMMSTVSD